MIASVALDSRTRLGYEDVARLRSIPELITTKTSSPSSADDRPHRVICTGIGDQSAGDGGGLVHRAAGRADPMLRFLGDQNDLAIRLDAARQGRSSARRKGLPSC